jgi:hypothetical protein
MRTAPLLVATFLAGCNPDPGAIEVIWHFPPERAGCEDVPAVETISALAYEGSLRYTQQIGCAVGQGILIPDVEPGSYSLIVDAIGASAARIYSATFTGLQVDEGRTQTHEFAYGDGDILPGTVTLTWTLPADCATDEVHDIRVVYDDGEGVQFDNGASDTLIDCDEAPARLTGSWIRTDPWPDDNALTVYGVDMGGVESHVFAVCAPNLQSGVENEVDVALARCEPDGICCPGGECPDLCP